MAAPANDLFANARYIYDGIQFGDDLTGSTLEAGEIAGDLGTRVAVGTRSVWYQWVPDVTFLASVSLPVFAVNQTLAVLSADPDIVTNTLSTLTYVTAVQNSTPVSFTATAGVTYYFRVYTSTSSPSSGNLFQVAYSPGRTPNALRAAGSNDLPTNLTSTVGTSAGFEIMEAVGYGPDSVVTTASINLLGNDEHSESSFAVTNPLVPNSDGSPSSSCERWVQIRFAPPFAAIANLRFWVNNYDPNGGWALYYGVTSEYRKPSTSISDIAVLPVPTSDPGSANLGVQILTGGQMQYSSWLVLQAVWIGGVPGPIQTAPLNFEFDWAEM